MTNTSNPDHEHKLSLSDATENLGSPTHYRLHKPQLKGRRSSEKIGQPQPSPKSPRDPKTLPPSSPGRRNSWISNISSKFSSSGNLSTTASTTSSPSVVFSTPSPETEDPKQTSATHPLNIKDIKKPEAPGPQSPQSPKSGANSFLHNALRRWSSASGGGGLGKATGTTATCPRKVMNIDPYRERCQIDDLQPAKLRRVAFCVDVEIAGVAKYTDEDIGDPLPPPPPGRRPSLTQLEHQADVKKKKDQRLKERSEGEALKNPQDMIGETEKEEAVNSGGGSIDSDLAAEDLLVDKSTNGEAKDSSRKREKKKRSEEERKERKERRKQEAVENGSVPVELSMDDSSTGDSSPGTSTPSKPQDRPTTDPLRIYRRCCQLRETPILKRIAEQLSSPSACNPNSPGTILCLDLSGYWMQPSDVITLGDYLAVVPVKKVILENCGLNDEGIRVILAGLLAAKTPSQAKHNKGIAKKKREHLQNEAEQLGVVEKLSLKNNPKIGMNGWRHIGLFIYMSRSLRAIDLSMISFPQSTSTSSPASLTKSSHNTKSQPDVPTTFQKALATRLAGGRLEELVMAECGLDTENIERIVDAVIQCGSTRLGLANNNMTLEGLQSVVRFVQNGKCEGLDLGGNDLSNNLHILAEVLDNKNSLYALSLADCNLSPSSLRSLFPALVRLPNFRFIDLSHNRNLFSTQPNALSLLRKFLPQLPILKRVHLADVALSPDHAIALAEVLSESKSLAHLNILENPLLSTLASAKDEASQEEACALYASLMAAVRVSDSIVCIDIDVPSQDSSEVVKALAKQVVAYSLRNMEHGPVAEAYASAAASIADPHGGEKFVNVPDILLHLVGHIDGFPENHDDDEPAPDDDYIVGGTGVVKALGVCLGNRVADYKRASRDITPVESGTATPKQVLQGGEMTKGKAKDMSKNLLGSARKIRARLQPALVREARNEDDVGYRRLQFLDSTLERMIQRFEDEFPECRVVPPTYSPSSNEALSDAGSLPSSFTNPFDANHEKLNNEQDVEEGSPQAEDDNPGFRIPVSRHNSDVSVASRYLGQEEGRMHRFGQQIRRDILRPQTLDYAHGTTGEEIEARHLQGLRERLEAMGGYEIKEKVERMGHEAVLKELGVNAEELLLLEKQDPEGFEKFKESQLIAQRNVEVAPEEEHNRVVNV